VKFFELEPLNARKNCGYAATREANSGSRKKPAAAVKFGTLMFREGDAFRIMAIHGTLPPKYVEERRRHPVMPATPGTGLAHLIAAKRPIQIADIREKNRPTERARARTRRHCRRSVASVAHQSADFADVARAGRHRQRMAKAPR
jgi:hypothetical protein